MFRSVGAPRKLLCGPPEQPRSSFICVTDGAGAIKDQKCHRRGIHQLGRQLLMKVEPSGLFFPLGDVSPGCLKAYDSAQGIPDDLTVPFYGSPSS